MSPDELLDEAEDEIESGLRMRKRKIKTHLIDFRKHLVERGLSDHTIKAYMPGVRSFYQCNDIELPKLQRAREKAAPIEENLKIPTKEDLQDVLRVCDPLEKAVLLCGVSSGLASNEIQKLTIKQFTEGYDPETEIVTLQMTRDKTKTRFITFISPEATRAIWQYLKYRNRDVKVATPSAFSMLNIFLTPSTLLIFLYGVKSTQQRERTDK